MTPRQQFEGCLLGLALGDALGAPFEGGPFERLLWRLIGRTAEGRIRWTDDTQMSLDLAEALIANGRVDADDLARRFAAGYRWSRGYGPGAAKILRRVGRGADWRQASRSVYPEGSFGNGGAMRAPVVGLFFAARPSELREAARLSAGVTHAHPLGVEGAVLVAVATATALTTDDPFEILQAVAAGSQSPAYNERLGLAGKWLASDEAPDAREVRHRLGNGTAASASVVTALYIALRHLDAPFLDMLSFVRSCRGDVDTIGAIAGAIWGAASGMAGLPRELLPKLEQYERLKEVAVALRERALPG